MMGSDITHARPRVQQTGVPTLVSSRKRYRGGLVFPVFPLFPELPYDYCFYSSHTRTTLLVLCENASLVMRLLKFCTLPYQKWAVGFAHCISPHRRCFKIFNFLSLLFKALSLHTPSQPLVGSKLISLSTTLG